MGSTTTINVNRTDIITKLKEQVKIAEAIDKAAAAKHKGDERDYLASFRAACREAAKWSYPQALKFQFDPMKDPQNKRDYQGNLINKPQCPISQAQWLKDELKRMELSNQETFKLASDSTLHRALMWDPNPPKGVCG